MTRRSTGVRSSSNKRVMNMMMMTMSTTLLSSSSSSSFIIIIMMCCTGTLTLFPRVITAQQEVHNNTSSSLSSSEQGSHDCGMYLAISSTSTTESTNWGLFIGESSNMLQDGPYIPIGPPEIGIIVSNLRIHNTAGGVMSPYHPTADLTKLVEYFEAFFWVPATAGAKFYFPKETTTTGHNSGERAIAAISGAGVLASYSKKMTNADWDHRSTYRRTTPTHDITQVSHPNRGAISQYYSCQIHSTVPNIKAGSEIFMEYGDSWSDKENEDDDEELSKDDYNKIDETVTQMIEFFNKYNTTVLDNDSRLEIYSFLLKDIMKAAVGATKARRIAAILPPNPNDLSLVITAGGTLAYSDPTSHRSISFLQKYGLCMDHIYPGPSTIPNIGRGAFAKRYISENNLVVPIPLTHVADKSIFNMYPLTTDPITGKLIRESDTVITQQLIINYCFGHPASSMVFFPSGSMTTLINHSTEPNAKLQWSTHPNHQKLWYEFDPHTTLMEEEYMYMGLILEVVALRDIEPNEEIFINYGTEWQAAYDEHVITWNQKMKDGIIPEVWPLRANDLNYQFHAHPFHNNDNERVVRKTTATMSALKPFPTIDEVDKIASIPSNIMLMAFLLLKDTPNTGTENDPKLWNTDDPNSAYSTENLFEVRILQRQPIELKSTDDDTMIKSYTYTVQWFSSKSDDDDNDSDNSNESTIIKDVPHDAFVYIDRPGTSDQQYLYEHSFRHYIGIPDDIFPNGPWRNIQ